MSNFETIKATLKDKWLDYYQDNQSWIIKMNDWYSSRPSAGLILGAISVLEPKIITYLIPMIELDTKGNKIIDELGLGFDPRTELEKRVNETNREEVLNDFSLSEIIDSVNGTEEYVYEIYDIKNNLKNQWLDYYQNNQYWILEFSCWVKCSDCWVKCSDSEDRRPMASLIFGSMSIIESRLKDYLIPLYGLNSSGEEIVKVLNLDFRPETELEKREEERKIAQEATLVETSNIAALDLEYRAVQEGLEEIRSQFKQLENSS